MKDINVKKSISAPNENLLERYVPHHNTPVKEVADEDIERVKQEAQVMFDLCIVPRGKYPGAVAIAHPQVNDKSPLRFFVTLEGAVIINPKMTNHSSYLVDKTEGCMTFPNLPMVKVQRYQKCEFEYQGITDDGTKLTEPILNRLSGKEAQIWQHEYGHLEGRCVYDGTEYEKEFKKPNDTSVKP